jgi:hypothetical protein
MNVLVIDRYTFGTPHLPDEQSLMEIENARRRWASRFLLRLLRLGIQLVIVLVLLGLVWVAPVLSQETKDVLLTVVRLW